MSKIRGSYPWTVAIVGSPEDYRAALGNSTKTLELAAIYQDLSPLTAEALFAPNTPWPEQGRPNGIRYGRVTREMAAGLLEALADRADKGEEITPEVVQEEWMATDAWSDVQSE